MSDKVYHGGIERLRNPKRLAMLEPDLVVQKCLEGMSISSVLDVGSGSGIFAELFSNAGMGTTGVDLNEEMVTAARELVPQATFETGSAESLPCEDKSFDLVFMSHVLHESDTPEVVLSEAKRVARCRIAVLEWPYQEEEMGPPLSHRLSPEQIKAAAKCADLSSVVSISLAHMSLYLIDI